MAGEQTVLILRQEATRPALRHPIEARLAAAGFKVLADALIHIGPGDPVAKGCRNGRNLVELVERPKAAVQVLRELVGAEDHPGGGTLRAIYGKDAVWCAKDQADVDDVVKAVFPERGVQAGEEKRVDQAPPADQAHPREEGSQGDESPREKRVFTFKARDDEPSTKKAAPHPLSPPTAPTPIAPTMASPPSEQLASSPPSAPLPPTLASTRSVSSSTTVSGTTDASLASLSTLSTASKADPGPRMSKAACLRLGIPWSPPARSSSSTSSVPSASDTPGVARRQLSTSELPASLLPPVIPPRHTKASSLRTGAPSTSDDDRSSTPSSSSRKDPAELYASTPGHKNRRASLQLSVASVAPPLNPPRSTRASALRQSYGGQVDASLLPIQPASTRRESLDTSQRGVGFEGTPGFKRLERVEVPPLKRPEWAPRGNRASLLRSGSSSSNAGGEALVRSVSREGSVPPTPRRAKTALGVLGEDEEVLHIDDDIIDDPEARRRATFQGVPGHKREASIPVASRARPPSVTPRLNRAAALRAGLPTSNSEPRPPTASRSLTAPSPAPTNSPLASRRSPVPPAPSIAPRTNRAAALRQSVGGAVDPSFTANRAEKENRRTSTAGGVPANSSGANGKTARVKHSSDPAAARNGTLRARVAPSSLLLSPPSSNEPELRRGQSLSPSPGAVAQPPGSGSSFGSGGVARDIEAVILEDAAEDAEDISEDVGGDEAKGEEGTGRARAESASAPSTTTSTGHETAQALDLSTPALIADSTLKGDYFSVSPAPAKVEEEEEQAVGYGHVTIISSSEKRLSPVTSRYSQAISA